MCGYIWRLRKELKCRSALQVPRADLVQLKRCSIACAII